MMTFKKYIEDSLENTALYVKSNYLFISAVAIVGFPLFYYVWAELFPQPYESLMFRLIGAVVFLPLIMIKRWPTRLIPYFKYYSVALLIYIVMFFFFMLIKNKHSEVWTLSTVCGVFLFVILTYEWLIAIFSFIVGVAIACGLAVITSQEHLVLLKYEHLPIYLFIVIAGSSFNHKKNIILQEKYNMLKAIGSSISYSMDTPLIKIKTAIEDLTKNINISKKYTEKDILKLLAEKLKQANEDLRKIQDELVKSEKMAALGRAVARIAHELNTPICITRSAAQNIETETKWILDRLETENEKNLKASITRYDNDLKKMLEVLMSGISRAAELVRNFKEVSNDQTNVQKRKFELYNYIKTTLSTMEAALKRKNITINLQGNEVVLHSDPGLFYQIIENLTTNVEKYAYGDEGGRIDITLKNGEHELILLFADYGKGIPQVHLSKIFDAFFTTGGGKGGTGLGLNIVYRIVTVQLKGTINCGSIEGKGTLFTLTIPKSSDDLKISNEFPIDELIPNDF